MIGVIRLLIRKVNVKGVTFRIHHSEFKRTLESHCLAQSGVVDVTAVKHESETVLPYLTSVTIAPCIAVIDNRNVTKVWNYR
jgi:hypothetical protein